MARKERERYTERKRPHRKETARPASAGASRAVESSPWSNPVVVLAALGLILAVVLGAGFVLGRDRTAPEAAEGEATSVITDTAQAASTAADVEVAEPVTGTEATAIPEGTLWLPAEGAPYTQPEDMNLDGTTNAYFAVIETISGTIRAELWPEVAPAHVNSFVFLAREGFFDGLTFHRVESWVVQGGDPNGDGSGGPGYSLPAEFNADNPINHRYGTLAMARTGDNVNSGGSQFYFVKDPAGAPFLDGQYTVFGHVVEGMDIVSALPAGTAMTKVTIEEKPKADSVISPDQIRAGDLPEPPPAASKD